jgi:hypothetical protein
MLRRLLWVLVGVAGALQFDRWLRDKRRRLTPNALTGTVLDKLNERLEANQARQRAKAGPSGPLP